jgi:hypothetical protein
VKVSTRSSTDEGRLREATACWPPNLATHTADDGTMTVYVSGPGVVASRLLPPEGLDLTNDAV